jgi:hypothetical protein
MVSTHTSRGLHPAGVPRFPLKASRHCQLEGEIRVHVQESVIFQDPVVQTSPSQESIIDQAVETEEAVHTQQSVDVQTGEIEDVTPSQDSIIDQTD